MRFAAVTLALTFGLFSAPLTAACMDGTQPGGAKYRICLPVGTWNRQLIVYAHGYVTASKPVAIPEDQLTLPDGTSLPTLFTSLGYAFATTSYRLNGLAVLEGQQDLLELTGIFNNLYGKPDATFLGGVSEGGLITALSAEKFPNTYKSAVAACGPIGSFSGQINYIGDARLLFDYYFPGVLPGTVVDVPPQLATNWDTVYVPAIKNALASNAVNRQNFLNASQIPVSTDMAVTAQNVVDTLDYSGKATNDAKQKLNGQPFDNRTKFYFGTTNDIQLNYQIARYSADAAAVQAMKLYETNGKPLIPLVTLHTIADPVIPWLHEAGYFFKALQYGPLRNLNQITVFRNGHCNFEPGDIIWAFLVMLAQQQNTTPQGMIQSLTESQRELLPSKLRSGSVN